MTKKVRAHCTASRLACMLFVRSVVKSVQAYCRFAMAIIAIMHAISLGQRGEPLLFPCAMVIRLGFAFVRVISWIVVHFSKAKNPRNHTKHPELNPAKGRR